VNEDGWTVGFRWAKDAPEVREIPVRRRSPAEARALMIAGGIPADMAEEIAGGPLTPAG
jgi:hypothetical protein